MTLIELLLALTMAVVLAGAIGFTFKAAYTLQKSVSNRNAADDRANTTEEEIRRDLEGAYLTTTATDTTTFFQGLNAGSETDLGCDRLTLTTTGSGVPIATQTDTTNDFETQQTLRGPVGGIAEVSISTTAVGDAGTKTGLYERLQRPSDGDPTQGGNEFVLDPNISEIGFQFWNGTQWVATWDTTTGDRRLPEAVQVSYRLTNDTQKLPYVFVVVIPESNVTENNPDSTQGGS